MPITNQTDWDKAVKNNSDSYGGAAIKTARRVMEILDEEPEGFDCHSLICRADDESCAGGISGFMAGCVANIVSNVHSRGEEFRRKWNKDNQIQDEGDEANKGKGVLNPASLSIK